MKDVHVVAIMTAILYASGDDADDAVENAKELWALLVTQEEGA